LQGPLARAFSLLGAARAAPGITDSGLNMLQQIRDKISGVFAAVFLGAIAVVFIFWGIRFESSATAAAVKVNGERIPLEVIRKAWQNRQQQLEQMLRNELPEDLKKSEQQRLLDEHIRRELVRQQAEKLGYRVSDRKLAESVYQIEALQVDGKFSRDRYAALLRQQGLSEAQFERDLREDLEIGEITNGIAVSAFTTPGEVARRQALEGELRDVEHATIPMAAFLERAVVTPDQVAKWYDDHKQEYMTPESVDLQYVEIKLADIAAGVSVSDEALHKYYDEVAAERYSTTEERRARHILIETGADAAAAKQRAEALLARVKAGEDFAKLARENSDDPGSKEQGGELGWAGRDAFVAPFADALFALEPGHVSDIVTTQFGYHIIELEEVRPATQRPFDDVRAELEGDYRREQAQSKFYELSQQLADESFAALTELESVGQKLGLPVNTVQGFTREGAAPFAGEKSVIEAAFSPDVVEQRQNSQPVSIGDDRVVVLRVTDHKEPVQRPLEDVKTDIETSLRADSARQAARGAAEAAATKVQSGSTLVAALADLRNVTVERTTLQRTDAELPRELVTAVFAAPRPASGRRQAGTAGLPSGDAAVFVIDEVRAGTLPDAADAAELGEHLQQGARLAGASELSAYVAGLERTAKIKRNDKVFE
jgi:peptidyl-prolyl cis-trans isomerase D